MLIDSAFLQLQTGLTGYSQHSEQQKRCIEDLEYRKAMLQSRVEELERNLAQSQRDLQSAQQNYTATLQTLADLRVEHEALKAKASSPGECFTQIVRIAEKDPTSIPRYGIFKPIIGAGTLILSGKLSPSEQRDPYAAGATKYPDYSKALEALRAAEYTGLCEPDIERREQVMIISIRAGIELFKTLPLSSSRPSSPPPAPATPSTPHREREPISILLGPRQGQNGMSPGLPDFPLRMFVQREALRRYGTREAIREAKRNVETIRGAKTAEARDIFGKALHLGVIRPSLNFGPHRAELARVAAFLKLQTTPLPMDADEAHDVRERLSFVMARQQKLSVCPLYILRRKLDRLGARVTPAAVEVIPGIFVAARKLYRDIDPLDSERQNTISSQLCVYARLYRTARGSKECKTLQDVEVLLWRLKRLAGLLGKSRERPKPRGEEKAARIELPQQRGRGREAALYVPRAGRPGQPQARIAPANSERTRAGGMLGRYTPKGAKKPAVDSLPGAPAL